MNTIYLILVILGFIVFDRIVRHKPKEEAKRKNSGLSNDAGNGPE
ncbi:MAG TPA: hypothetical protein VGM92_01255 [Candidatus Kapabacteria bacterium]|jgi:hypothetical protein